MRGRQRCSGKRDAKEGREGKIGIRSHTAREQRVCNRQTGAARRRHAPWQIDGRWGTEKRGVASAPRTCGPGARRKGGRDRDGGDATGVSPTAPGGRSSTPAVWGRLSMPPWAQAQGGLRGELQAGPASGHQARLGRGNGSALNRAPRCATVGHPVHQ